MSRRLLPILLFLSAGCFDEAAGPMSMQNMFGHKKSDHSAELTEARSPHHPKPAETIDEERPEKGSDTAQAPDETPTEQRPVPVVKSAPSPPPTAVKAEGLVVDDETITVTDILEPLQSRLPSMSSGLSAESYWRQVGEMVRSQIIEAVAQHLIWRRAKQQLTDELKPQVEKIVEKMEKERINREFEGRETAYEQYMTKHGKSREDIRQRLRRVALIDSYLRDRLLPLVPQPRKAELEEYYHAHIDDFSQPAKREMFLIDVPLKAFLDLTRPVSNNDKEIATRKARQTIEDAREAIKQGDSFESVARKYSYGLHKEEGGNWGWITFSKDGSPLQGYWKIPSQKLFELKPGQTSDVIVTDYSFFIVKVGQIDPGKTLTFQEAQPEITNTLRQQAFMKLRTDFLQRELDRSTISSLDDFLRSVMTAIQERGTTTLATEQDCREAVPGRSPRVNTQSKKAMSPTPMH